AGDWGPRCGRRSRRCGWRLSRGTVSGSPTRVVAATSTLLPESQLSASATATRRRLPPPTLSLIGGKRRRVAVAEADNCDSGSKVEVAATTRVGEPDTVPLDNRHPHRRLRRPHRGPQSP